MKRANTFANVWDAIEDSPEDAAVMAMRSNVMIAIKDKVDIWSTTQARAARRLGITQPRLNDLLQRKINKFSRDTLMILASRVGLKVKIDLRSDAHRPARRACSGRPSARQAAGQAKKKRMFKRS